MYISYERKCVPQSVWRIKIWTDIYKEFQHAGRRILIGSAIIPLPLLPIPLILPPSLPEPS